MKKRIMWMMLGGALGIAVLANPSAAEARTPASAGQRFALAQRYRAEANNYRDDEARHLKAADGYWYSSVNSNLRAKGSTNPQIEKPVARESDLAAQAAARAASAEQEATFYELRAKELGGS